MIAFKWVGFTQDLIGVIFPNTFDDSLLVFLNEPVSQSGIDPFLAGLRSQRLRQLLDSLLSGALDDPQPELALEFSQHRQGILRKADRPAYKEKRDSEQIKPEHNERSLANLAPDCNSGWANSTLIQLTTFALHFAIVSVEVQNDERKDQINLIH